VAGKSSLIFFFQVINQVKGDPVNGLGTGYQHQIARF
jgi:hypothetical protein